MRVWQSLAKGEFAGHFRGWLFTIARNYLIDLSRKKQPELLVELPEDGNVCPALAADVLLMERKRVLEERLEKLGEQAANVVRGRLAGESYVDVAARLELGVARAHRIWHGAKQKLQDCVQQFPE